MQARCCFKTLSSVPCFIRSLLAQMFEVRQSDILSRECTCVRHLDIKRYWKGFVRDEVETITRSLAGSAVREGGGGRGYCGCQRSI